MCGITGIANFGDAPDPDYRILETMCATLHHRGPDEAGLEVRDGVALGMRRLAIIDLSGGSQPVFNEDRSVRTVYNGEIYNFQELRAELVAQGHCFRSACDTEVIVHAYESKGAFSAERFNGMFAYALHDMVQRKLFLVRDPLGIKPLYYALLPDKIIWGSEIKAVLASGEVPREIDLQALGDFLAWEYVPGERTLFKAVRKLLPGYLMEVDLAGGQVRMHEYWDVPLADASMSCSDAQWENEVDTTLKRAVKQQLVSDVPLGAFLSGGVDSSLVVAAMGRADTFSIGFNDASYNELPWAQRVADHLGVSHLDDVITPDVSEMFAHLMHFMDDPIGDFSIFPTWLVSRHARRHVTVSLSGDGGDELFGGYETYLAQQMAQLYSRIPGWMRQVLIEGPVKRLKPRQSKKGLVNKALRYTEGFSYPKALAHARWRLFMGDAMRESFFTPDALEIMPEPAGMHILRLFERAGERQSITRCLYVDLKSYLCDNCLVKVDRMSMAVSLEVRVPFLDKEVVALAFRLPDRLKVDRGRTKVLLKKVAARHLPRQCVYRPKEGFSIPIKNWLGNSLRPLMEELLDMSRIKADGLFNPGTVERLKSEHLAGTANHSHVLWSLMVFQEWQRRWLRQ